MVAVRPFLITLIPFTVQDDENIPSLADLRTGRIA
jgi:hypothetical protein